MLLSRTRTARDSASGTFTAPLARLISPAGLLGFLLEAIHIYHIAPLYFLVTKPVALADNTYDRLKRRKRPGESFSAAIERLMSNQRKDPLEFVRLVPKSKISAGKRLAEIEADREASWEDA